MFTFVKSKIIMWGAFATLFVAMGLGGFLTGQHIESVDNELKIVKAQEIVRVKMQADVDKERARYDTISTNLEKKLEKLAPIYTTINRRVEKEIIEKEVYRQLECSIPESGVDIINAGATELNESRKVKP